MFDQFLAVRPRLVTVLLVMMAGIVVSGCGAGAKPAIARVHGKALTEGKPLPQGCLVSFHSRTGAHAFSAMVNHQGEYWYEPPVDVALAPGEYTVTVTPPGRKVINVDGLAMPDPSDTATYPLIFPSYGSASTSPLKAKLSPGETTVDIDLRKS